MKPNLPALKDSLQKINRFLFSKDIIVNGATVGKGGGNQPTNTANGVDALKANTTGNYNTASGTQALQNNTTGSNNVANGNQALQINSTGNYNTASGCKALQNNTTGNYNTASGTQALQNNSTGSNNVASGYAALFSNTTGGSNTASGSSALQNNTTGSYNTASGMSALYSNSTGYYNIANGYQALQNNTTGSYNTASGMSALYSNSTGYYNTANGVSALNNNTTGSYNTAKGYQALHYNTTGNNNVASGYRAMFSNTTGSYNVANGAYAGYLQNGQTIAAGSFVVGASYMILTTGTTDYTLIGAANSSVGTVFIATGIGSGTGTATLNHQTSALGYNSSYSNLSGHNVTALGVNSLYGNTTFYNVTGVGANTAVTGSNQVQLGDAATTTYAYGAIQDRSDIRDKADVRDTTLGLAFIESLRPVDFKWDKREDYRTQPPLKPEYPDKPTQPERVDTLQLEDETNEDYRTRVEAEWQTALDTYEADYKVLTDVIDNEFAVIHDAWLEANKLANITHDGSHKRNRYHHGVIAQEVPAEFGGLQNHSLKGGDDVWSVGYEEFIAPLIKAVQELSAENKILKQHLGI